MPYKYELLEGRDREGARKALAKAEKGKFPREAVISVENGWLVPVEEVKADEPLGAVEATIDAWGEDLSDLEGKSNIENVEALSQPADSENAETEKKTTRQRKSAKADEENKE